jgi:putative ABC transport system permease protein
MLASGLASRVAATVAELFLIVGVAIGVAMIVAIDLANGSAERAFQLGTETVTGKATHQITGGPGGLDEALYARLRTEGAYRLSAPVVESYVVADALDSQPVRLLGVDPFAEPPFRSYLGPGDQTQGPAAAYLSELMVQPNTVLISSEVAARYGLAAGDTLTVRHGVNRIDLTIAGLLAPSDDLSRRALDGLLATDIATAQEVLGKVGRLDRIDLIVPPGAAGEAVLERLSALLPPGARIDPTAARTGAVNEMTAAFQLNLTALSLLALVVGMFLIYNTVTFSVVQRRPVLGSLRALGMTRGEIFGMILLEAMLLGALGTLLGLALGVLLGRGAVQLGDADRQRSLLRGLRARNRDSALYAAQGRGDRAGRGADRRGLPGVGGDERAARRRAQTQQRRGAHARKCCPGSRWRALGFLAAGAGLMLPEWNLVITFAGLFAVVIGAALLTPMLTLWGMAGVARLVRGRGVLLRMAPRTVTRSLSRIAVAVAALMVAVSVIIGVGVMIGSFRQTVVLWLDDVLQADIFISPPSLASNTVETALDPALLDRMLAFPGVEGAATTRGVDVVASAGASGADRADPAGGAEPGFGRSRPPLSQRGGRLAADVAGGARRRHPDQRADGEPPRPARGRRVAIQTDRGEQAFPIAGVTVDFDVRSVVFIDDAVYRRWYDDDRISAIALFVAPGVDVDAKVVEIRAAFAGERGIAGAFQSRHARECAGRLRPHLYDHRGAATAGDVVAFIGILSTLMSLQFERSREIGVLRATGMTRRQLWRLSLLETGLVGAVAGCWRCRPATCWRVILIYIINLRSFGWTLEMRLDPDGVCAGVLGGAGGGAAGRRLPGVEDRQYPAGDCGAVGVTNS